MPSVTILGFDNAFATAITGAVDVFSAAGSTWNRIQGEATDPRFQVRIASLDGGAIYCTNGLRLPTDESVDQVGHTDLLLIPTIGDHIQKTLDNCQPLLSWIRALHEQRVDIASNCTGAFLLAESGILNGKKATTHWGFANAFKRRYPEVLLEPERLITRDANIFCAGGGMAWLDLTIFLIERYCGHDLARATARSMVIDMSRSSQSAYGTVPAKHYHQDPEILMVQDWLGSHYQERIQLDNLARQFLMTPRTFKRRFSSATGESPISYLQSLRIEQAKRLLESTKHNLDFIIQSVGYEDISSFSRLFKRCTGMAPGAYRVKFGRA